MPPRLFGFRPPLALRVNIRAVRQPGGQVGPEPRHEQIPIHQRFALGFGQTVCFKSKGQKLLNMGQVTLPVGRGRFFINGLVVGQRRSERIDAHWLLKLPAAHIAKKAVTRAAAHRLLGKGGVQQMRAHVMFDDGVAQRDFVATEAELRKPLYSHFPTPHVHASKNGSAWRRLAVLPVVRVAGLPISCNKACQTSQSAAGDPPRSGGQNDGATARAMLPMSFATLSPRGLRPTAAAL